MTARRLVVRRFLRHRLAVGSLVVLAVVVAISLIGGRYWSYRYDEITAEFSTGPSLRHPFGTDGPGHDVLAQVLRGAQKSVQIMLIVGLVSTVVGVIVGVVAGYFRGVVESLLMRCVDLILTVPLLGVVAVLATAVRDASSWALLAIVLGLLVWTGLARIVRAECLVVCDKEFVYAAKVLGVSAAGVIWRHVLPNIAGSIIVSATLTMAGAILLETTLSFLGLGVQTPDTSLGKLVADGQSAAVTRPWLFYFPGLVIVVIVLCVNFIGDGLRDAFDPHRTLVRS
ncbi:MAG: ABC transporter permease [Acidimicrobiales bacterium]